MHCGSNGLLQKLGGGGGPRNNFTWTGGCWRGSIFLTPNPSPLDPRMIWIWSICFAPGMYMDIIRSRSLRTLYGTLYETSYIHTSSCSSPGCRGGVTQAKWLVQISHLVEPLYRTHSFRQEWWTLDKYPRQSHSVELKPSSSQTTFKWYDRELEIITHFLKFLKSLK